MTTLPPSYTLVPGIEVNDEKLDHIQARVLPSSAFHFQDDTQDGITIEPYSPAVGGRVKGLRITADTTLSASTLAFINASLLKYGFLSFEPGTVTPEHFEKLVAIFGTPKLMNTPYTPETGKDGQLNAIDSSIKKTRMNYIWHMDQVFQKNPPRFTALFGQRMPRLGGGTLFTNATLATELLDPKLVEYLETLTAVHDVEAQGFLTYAYHDQEKRTQERLKAPPIEVPLIRVHPETGRKQIFANELYTLRILGVTRRTSESLLNILFDALTSPEVQALHNWQDGTALIWDNRTVQHRGVPNFGDQRRVLHRALVL